MMRTATKGLRFSAVLLALGIVGAGAGYILSGQAFVIPYKLLNVAGILYGLLGLIVLAEFVVKSEKAKRFMVTYVAGGVLWSSTVLPLGMLAGAGIAYAAHRPSAAVMATFGASFWAWSILPLAAVDAAVFTPSRLIRLDLDGRHQVLGLVLVLAGAVLQLAAALCDLLA